MKIMYIHPDTTELRDSQCSIPIGVVGLNNILIGMGNDVIGISVPVEKFTDPNFNLEAKIKSENPDVVLVDLHWAIYAYSSIETCRLVKRINKDTITIIGGITASIYYEEILDTYDFIDIILKGESEVSLEKLFSNFKLDYKSLKDIPNISYRLNNNIFHNDITIYNTNLENYNFYNYDFLSNKDLFFKKQGKHKENEDRLKLAWIPTGRGCSYNCSYCGGNTNMFKNVFKTKCMYNNSVNSIMEMMKMLNKNYGINCFGITHDFGIFAKEFWTNIISELKKLNFKPGIHNYLFQIPDINYMKDFIACTDEIESIVGIPVVCGNEDDRKMNGKYFTNEELFNFLNLFINKKTKVEIYFIANPLYGYSKYNETIDLIRKIKNKYLGLINFDIACGFEIIQPYSKKQISEDKKASLVTFKDFYYRYSFEFLEDIKKGKNIKYLVGEMEYDENLAKIIKEINEAINE